MESESNQDEFIPCEFCETQVPFSQYLQHVEACRISTRIPNYMVVRDDDFEEPLFIRIALDQAINMINDMNLQDRSIQQHEHDSDGSDNSDNEAENYIPLTTINHQRLSFIPSHGQFIPLHFDILDGNNYELNNLLADAIGIVPSGIKDITKVLREPIHFNKDEVCSICQDTIKNPVETLCHHLFCKECIEKWFTDHKTCPICISNQEDMLEENAPKN